MALIEIDALPIKNGDFLRLSHPLALFPHALALGSPWNTKQQVMGPFLRCLVFEDLFKDLAPLIHLRCVDIGHGAGWCCLVLLGAWTTNHCQKMPKMLVDDQQNCLMIQWSATKWQSDITLTHTKTIYLTFYLHLSVIYCAILPGILSDMLTFSLAALDEIKLHGANGNFRTKSSIVQTITYHMCWPYILLHPDEIPIIFPLHLDCLPYRGWLI